MLLNILLLHSIKCIFNGLLGRGLSHLPSMEMIKVVRFGLLSWTLPRELLRDCKLQMILFSISTLYCNTNI